MRRPASSPASGVTLLELLLATAVAAAVILAALALWQVGLRDRGAAADRSADLRRIARLRERLRRDLEGAVYTGGAIAARFAGGDGEVRLALTTTGARRGGRDTGGDIALVEYWRDGEGRLLRSVRRDLLATVWTAVEGVALIDEVETFEPLFYDGSAWVSSWEVEQAGALPRAVEIRIQWTDRASGPARSPFGLVVPLRADAARTGDGA